MDFAKPTIIKISASGDHMPGDASGHAAILYPDFGIQFAVGAKGFSKRMDHDDSVQRAAELTHAGESNWIIAPDYRLLLLTIDASRFNPASDPDLYPDMESDWYWTDHGCAWSKQNGSPRAFWQVSASLGHVNRDGRSSQAFARPCRFVARAGQ